MMRVVIPDAKPCPHETRYDGLCLDCEGTGYVIPSSVRSDRPAQPGDTIELAVETSVGCWHGAPVTHRSERVVAVATVAEWFTMLDETPASFTLTLANPRPPSHKENP
jgi:hypothetical protein